MTGGGNRGGRGIKSDKGGKCGIGGGRCRKSSRVVKDGRATECYSRPVVWLMAEAAELAEATSGVMCSGVATMTGALGTKGVQRVTGNRSAGSGMSTWGGRGSKSARLKELTEMAGVLC